MCAQEGREEKVGEEIQTEGRKFRDDEEQTLDELLQKEDIHFRWT